MSICFKIHANMDPKHRDRLAFIKNCFWNFWKKQTVLSRSSKKNLKFSSPNAFFCWKRDCRYIPWYCWLTWHWEFQNWR
jgi:peptide subunit release factor RF-3